MDNGHGVRGGEHRRVTIQQLMDVKINPPMPASATHARVSVYQRHIFDHQPTLESSVKKKKKATIWRTDWATTGKRQRLVDLIDEAYSFTENSAMMVDIPKDLDTSKLGDIPVGTVDTGVVMDIIANRLMKAVSAAVYTATDYEHALKFERPFVPGIPDIMGFDNGGQRVLMLAETLEFYEAFCKALEEKKCGSINWCNDSLPKSVEVPSETGTKRGLTRKFEWSLNGIMRKVAIYMSHYGVQWVCLASFGGVVIFYRHKKTILVEVVRNQLGSQGATVKCQWMRVVTLFTIAAVSNMQFESEVFSIPNSELRDSTALLFQWPKYERFYESRQWKVDANMKKIYDVKDGVLDKDDDDDSQSVRSDTLRDFDLFTDVEAQSLHIHCWGRRALRDPSPPLKRSPKDITMSPVRKAELEAELHGLRKEWMNNGNSNAPRSVLLPVPPGDPKKEKFRLGFPVTIDNETIELPRNWYHEVLNAAVDEPSPSPDVGTSSPVKPRSDSTRPNQRRKEEDYVFGTDRRLDELYARLMDKHFSTGLASYTMDQLRGACNRQCRLIWCGTGGRLNPERVYWARAEWFRIAFGIDGLRFTWIDEACVVTGQPGIGKSSFLFFLLVLFLSRREPVLLIPRLTQTPAFYLFTEDGVYAGPVLSNPNDEIKIPAHNLPDRFIVLVDSKKGDGDTQDKVLTTLLSPNCSPFVIYTSSPTIKRWAVSDRRITVFLMNPWAWTELKLAYTQIFLSGNSEGERLTSDLREGGGRALKEKLQAMLQELAVRYLNFGPTPRGCFGIEIDSTVHANQVDALDALLNSLKRLQAGTMNLSFAGGDSSRNGSTMSHRIVVVFRLDLNNIKAGRNLVYFPLSTSIRWYMQKEIDSLNADLRAQALHLCLSVAQLRNHAGGSFESYCHDFFSTNISDIPEMKIRPMIMTTKSSREHSRIFHASDGDFKFVPHQTPKTKGAPKSVEFDTTFILNNVRGSALVETHTTFEENVYYQPLKSNEAGIDALCFIMDMLFLFQDTVADSKTLVWNFLKLLMDHSKHSDEKIKRIIADASKWRFIYVIPLEDPVLDFRCTETTTSYVTKEAQWDPPNNWKQMGIYLLRLNYQNQAVINTVQVSKASKKQDAVKVTKRRNLAFDSYAATKALRIPASSEEVQDLQSTIRKLQLDLAEANARFNSKQKRVTLTLTNGAHTSSGVASGSNSTSRGRGNLKSLQDENSDSNSDSESTPEPTGALRHNKGAAGVRAQGHKQSSMKRKRDSRSLDRDGGYQSSNSTSGQWNKKTRY